MKTLNEEIERIKSIMGLIVEQETSDKSTILIDGTSSAGKSMTAKLLNAVPFYEATDPNQWVVIDSDHFVGEGNDGEERRLKLDPPSIRDWAKGKDSGIVSGLYREDDNDVPPNPKENEYIKGTDPRLWYMAEEYKTGPWKKVIFDDIGKDILKYVPNIKHNILLHTPLYILLQNIGERNQKNKIDYRDPADVLSQYLNKYEATKQKPDENKGDTSTELTNNGLKDLLSQSIDDDEFIDDFISDLGVKDDGIYYIKVKDKYLTPNTQLINVDSDRIVYLDKFKEIVT